MRGINELPSTPSYSTVVVAVTESSGTSDVHIDRELLFTFHELLIVLRITCLAS
jgi:hypothetical protein